MKVIKINGNEYKIKFTYRSLARTNVLDKAVEYASGTPEETGFNDFIRFIAEMFLCGLQKFHSDEFGYDTDEAKEEKIDDVYDLMDMYDEESPENAGTLMEILFEELTNNGFLSALARQNQEPKNRGKNRKNA